MHERARPSVNWRTGRTSVTPRLTRRGCTRFVQRPATWRCGIRHHQIARRPTVVAPATACAIVHYPAASSSASAGSGSRSRLFSCTFPVAAPPLLVYCSAFPCFTAFLPHFVAAAPLSPHPPTPRRRRCSFPRCCLPVAGVPRLLPLFHRLFATLGGRRSPLASSLMTLPSPLLAATVFLRRFSLPPPPSLLPLLHPPVAAFRSCRPLSLCFCSIHSAAPPSATL